MTRQSNSTIFTPFQFIEASDYRTSYCPECNIWVEDKCDDLAACRFCVGRPDKPFETLIRYELRSATSLPLPY